MCLTLAPKVIITHLYSLGAVLADDDYESDTESEDDNARMSENILSDLEVDKTQDSGWDESQGSDMRARKFNVPPPSKLSTNPTIVVQPPTEKRVSRGSRKSKH